MALHKSSKLQFWATVGLLTLGAALVIAGFIITPVGEIHNSVLIVFGEILSWTGAVLGIDYHYRAVHSVKDSSKDLSDEQETDKQKA